MCIRDRWTHPPFAGVVADGALWGRGAMDDKSGLVGILEAVEGLLAEGFVPQRTVYLSFGHDEETLGEGSLAAAALLRERGVRLSWVLDGEGLKVGADQGEPLRVEHVLARGVLGRRLGQGQALPEERLVRRLGQGVVERRPG